MKSLRPLSRRRSSRDGLLGQWLHLALVGLGTLLLLNAVLLGVGVLPSSGPAVDNNTSPEPKQNISLTPIENVSLPTVEKDESPTDPDKTGSDDAPISIAEVIEFSEATDEALLDNENGTEEEEKTPAENDEGTGTDDDGSPEEETEIAPATEETGNEQAEVSEEEESVAGDKAGSPAKEHERSIEENGAVADEGKKKDEDAPPATIDDATDKETPTADTKDVPSANAGEANDEEDATVVTVEGVRKEDADLQPDVESKQDGSAVYRINVGGPAVNTKAERDWSADHTEDPPIYLNSHKSDTVTAHLSDEITREGTVPASTPDTIFQTYRWDRGNPDDPYAAMTWEFPVNPDHKYEVRLYFVGKNTGESRIFDVSIDDEIILRNYDPLQAHGRDAGSVQAFEVVNNDGLLTIQFHSQEGDALISGIEIVDRGPHEDNNG